MKNYYRAVHAGSADDAANIKQAFAKLLQQQKCREPSGEINEASNDAIRLYKKLLADDRIDALLKVPIKYCLYGDKPESEHGGEELACSLDGIQNLIDSESTKVMDSISMLGREYRSLYRLAQDFYDAVLQSARVAVKTNTQWHSLVADHRVTVSLKCLVGVWLTHSMTEKEREYHFNNQMAELSKKSGRTIESSLETLRKSYPVLYQQCEAFLEVLHPGSKKPSNIWKCWLTRFSSIFAQSK